MNSDSIMLDSPAQTPTPKSQPAPPINVVVSGTVPTDISMMIDDNNSGASATGASTNSWDTKKYREELYTARSRLQHQNFEISKFRDPMNKPLVTAPRDLTSEMQDRMRKLFQERTGR